MLDALAQLPPEAWSLCTALAACVLLAKGAACLYLAQREREPGLRLLGLAAWLLAVFYVLDATGLHKPRGEVIKPSLPIALLVTSAIVCWTVGLGQVLGLRRGGRLGLLGLFLLPPLLINGLLALGVPLPRAGGNAAMSLVFVGMAALAWRQRRLEPRAGHGWIALSIASMPSLAIVLLVTGSQTVALRYLIVAPLLVFYLTVLVVTLRRRTLALETEVGQRRGAEHALAQLNASLERTVQQRTADLHDIIGGLESFNRSVSHDLRGPLGGIEGAAQLAVEAIQRGDMGTARSLVLAIGQQAQTSRVLVQSLLELARVGDAQLARAPVSLAALASEAIEDIRRQSAGRNLPLFELQALPTVQADAGLLKPVLHNLIGNACKFSEGQPEPRVEIGSRVQDQRLTVWVRDNGVGFQPEQADTLFQPFHRLHGREYQGHGVGLSIVRRAVERHGGTVWAEARPGHGACFYFTLPDEAAG